MIHTFIIKNYSLSNGISLSRAIVRAAKESNCRILYLRDYGYTLINYKVKILASRKRFYDFIEKVLPACGDSSGIFIK